MTVAVLIEERVIVLLFVLLSLAAEGVKRTKAKCGGAEAGTVEPD